MVQRIGENTLPGVGVWAQPAAGWAKMNHKICKRWAKMGHGKSPPPGASFRLPELNGLNILSLAWPQRPACRQLRLCAANAISPARVGGRVLENGPPQATQRLSQERQCKRQTVLPAREKRENWRASAPENAEPASPPSCPGEDFYHHARDRPQRHWKKPPQDQPPSPRAQRIAGARSDASGL